MRIVGILKVSILIIIVAAINVVLLYAENPLDPNEAVDRLENLESIERETTEKLFALYSDIEFSKSELEAMENRLAGMQMELSLAEQRIDELIIEFETTKESLKSVLIARQKMGSVSLFQMVFESKNLSDLLDRLNLIKDLVRNSDALLEKLEVQEEVFTKEKMALEMMYKETELQKSELQNELMVLNSRKAELESFLESLSTEKSTYELYLSSIDEVWTSIKPMFLKSVTELNRIIERSEFPEDTVRVSFSFLSARGVLQEERFNQVLSEKQSLPTMIFDFQMEQVILEMPDYQLKLIGNFILMDPKTVVFNVSDGLFYGLPMNSNALDDLFGDVHFTFDLGALLGKNEIKEIIHEENQLILSIGIKLF